MSDRRKEPREERRRDRIELNLLAEDEDLTSRNVLTRARRGCSLPFLGIFLVFTCLLLLKPGLG